MSLLLAAAALMVCTAGFSNAGSDLPQDEYVKAAVITCHGMIDDGLYRSIQRRTDEALGRGVKYLIYDISTYGGLVQSADDISKFLIHEAGKKARTVAYVSTEAISAGAMVAVACQDILMKENTTIGCSAPIMMGDKLEGAEREKIESFLRAAFSRAAQANGYPEALLKAMVSAQIEVYQILNKKTSQYEYFEKDYLPKDANTYDLAGKRLVDKEGELLTLTDKKALEYGIARSVVQDLDAGLEFLSRRDNVLFDRPVIRMKTNWSEELVRWLSSPVVVGILVMGIMLGIYVELHTPGIGLPSLLAIVCLVILVGSKYLTGLANWLEVAVLLIGFILLAVEIFVIPGFGIAGLAGIVCIMAGLFGMLIRNAPNEIPWPSGDFGWQVFTEGVIAVFCGVAGFAVLAVLLARFIPKMEFLSGLLLTPTALFQKQQTEKEQGGAAALSVGLTGVVLTELRPAGKAKFGPIVADVVAQAEFLEKGQQIQIAQINGNRILVCRKQG